MNSTHAPADTPTVSGATVSIFVPDDHPILRLKRALDWVQIKEIMMRHWREAGKNVDGGRGLPWPTQLYMPLLVLMWLKSYHSRQMEEYLTESVVARRFLDLEIVELRQIRDHSNIARAEAALGAAGKAEINALILRTAQELGLTDGRILSADTTVQEPAIGYPNEPGILKGLAQRVDRAMKKLKKRGLKAARAGIEKAEEIYQEVKNHHLFAATKEEKQKILRRIVKKTEELIKITKEVIEQVGKRSGRVKLQAVETLKRMVEVSRRLLPQVKSWMKTGKVATEKIIHAGITEARAIVKGRGKKQVKFGLKWLICMLAGGYLLGRRVDAYADENKMPEESLKDYQNVFGEETAPEMLVYDRGASLAVVEEKLKEAGVKTVGIPPRGKSKSKLSKADQKLVKSQRGMTEGVIGRLKSGKYGLSRRQERSAQTQEAAGQRAIVSANLNTLMRDLTLRAAIGNSASA
jgi:IS5 family transposase